MMHLLKSYKHTLIGCFVITAFIIFALFSQDMVWANTNNQRGTLDLPPTPTPVSEQEEQVDEESPTSTPTEILEEGVEVSGILIDLNTREALAGIKVQLGDQFIETNSAGIFRFSQGFMISLSFQQQRIF